MLKNVKIALVKGDTGRAPNSQEIQQAIAENPSIVVDETMVNTATKQWLDVHGVEGMTVDSELSATSTNPVQNKVITANIDSMGGVLETLEGGIERANLNIESLDEEITLLNSGIELINDKLYNIGKVLNGDIDTRTTLSTTTQKMGSIGLTAGVWVITVKVALNGTVSADTTIRWNLAITEGATAVNNSSVALNGQHFASESTNIYNLTSNTVYYLNVRTSTGTPKLSDKSFIKAVRIA